MKKTYFIFALLLVSETACFAQAIYSACFNADTISYNRRGCVPLTVKMIDCSMATSAPNYFYDVAGAPLTYTDSIFHTYTKPGKYSIRQVVIRGGLPGTDDTIKTDYIEVLQPTVPNFSVQVCKNMLVNVILKDGVYDKYIIDFGDGTIDTATGPSIVSNTYITPGSKNIIVKGIYLPSYCGASATKQITPLSNLISPAISSLQVTNQANSNGSITLVFTPVSGQKYLLEQSTGSNSSYIITDTLPAGLAVVKINNLNTQSTQYCYRITSYDDCGDTLHSPEVCSETITATALNNQNQIDFSNYSGNTFFRYLLYSGGQKLDSITSKSTIQYFDNAVKCGTTYCYSVVTETTNAGNRIRSISDTSCVKAISTNIPAPLQNLHSTISGNSVLLFWDKPTAFSVMQYQILRSANGGSFSSYATSTINSYTDNSADVNGTQYCYKVNYSDSCGKSSTPGTTTCPVLLQGNEAGNGIVDLSWSSYTGCSNGIQYYTVLILNPADNTVKSSVLVGLNNSYTDNTADPLAVSLKYQIKATCSNPGINTSFSNIFEINHNLKLFLPDAFTPNGDGDNDVFIPKGKYVQEFKMTIFNRWGEIVFYTDKFTEGWDGNYKGNQAASDAYAYMIEAVDYFGKQVHRKGTVTLLR